MLQELQERLNHVKTTFEVRRNLSLKKKTEAEQIAAETKEALQQLQASVDVLSRVAELSRRDTIDRIEQLITFALQNIFREESFKFFIRTQEQKNGILFSFFLQEEGSPPYQIKESVGVGLLNVISTFLAIIVSILQNPKSRRFFVLDERFKHVSPDNQERIAETIKLFAEKLNCQFLVISHSPSIKKAGDIIYSFTKVKGQTKSREIQIDS